MDNLSAILDGISVNTQSSIRAACGGTVVRFDPLGIAGEPRDADVVFVTHAHGDHFSPADIAKVSKPGTVLVVPASMADQAKESVSLPLITAVPGQSGEAAGIPFEAVPAYNRLKPFHPKRNQWTGYIVTLGGARIYVAGDTDAVPELESVRCDAALVPVGGKYTMTAKEAAELVNRMRLAAAIPTHYGSIVGKPEDGAAFAALVGEGIRVELKL